MWAQSLGIAVVLVEYRLRIEPVARGAEGMKHLVLDAGNHVDPCPEVGAVHVAEADGQRAADLVAVTGPDAAHGGSDCLAGALLIEQAIFLDVPGEDHVGPDR